MCKVVALRQKRLRCKDYDSFRRVGEQLDEWEGLLQWKLDDRSPHFDAAVLKARIEKYKQARAVGDVEGCLVGLQGSHLLETQSLAQQESCACEKSSPRFHGLRQTHAPKHGLVV